MSNALTSREMRTLYGLLERALAAAKLMMPSDNFSSQLSTKQQHLITAEQLRQLRDELRDELDWTNARLAGEMKITPQHLCRLMNGQGRIRSRLGQKAINIAREAGRLEWLSRLERGEN